MATMTEEQRQQAGSTPFAMWGAAATVVGLASDLLRPLGNFALFLLVLCVAAAIALLVMSRRKPELKKSAGFAGIGVVVFGLVTLLQVLAPTDESGVKRGFIASTVTPVAAVQSALLDVPSPALRASSAPAPQAQPAAAAPVASVPVVAAAPGPTAPAQIWMPPATKEPADYSAALQVALADADAGNRVRAARFALGSTDTAFQAAAIEQLYRSPQAELRQAAITTIFQTRTGRAHIPLVVVEGEGSDPELSNALQGASLYVQRVDEVTGGVVGNFAGSTLNGSITRSGINFSTTLQNRGAVSLSLQPTADFSLAGTLRTQDGKSVRVQMPLM
jgi:hypothetical protein